MTINDVRESDLKRIIDNLHWDYYWKKCKLESVLTKWSVKGEPIKVTVLDSTRELFNMAERNLEYLNLLVNQYKSIGYLESEELNNTMYTETLYYKEELASLRQLKTIIPLVKPIVQLKQKAKG